MLKGAAYIRVSTNEQTEYSPDAQLKAIRDFSAKNNIMLLPEYIYIDEGISGRSTNKRLAFNAMIKQAKKKPKPFDVILIHKFDRFARNREDSVVFKALLRKECGIKVVSITEHMEDDKFAVILEAMLEAMAEFYSLNLSEEVRKGMAEKASRGGIQQKAPYGYKNENNTLTIIPEQADVVKNIYKQFIVERKGLKEIADDLNNMGIRTKNSNRFQSKTIRYILTNPTYKGYVRWNRKNKNGTLKAPDKWIIERGGYKSIIDEALYDKAQINIELLKKTDTKNARPSYKYKHYLSGLIRCEYCGGMMGFTRTKKEYTYFRCRKAYEGGCDNKKLIRTKKLEEAVLEQIQQDFNKIDLIVNDNITHNTSEDMIIYENQLTLINKKFNQAKQAYLEGVDSLVEYKKNKCIFNNEKVEIAKKISEIHFMSTKKERKEFNRYKLEHITELMKNTNISIEEKNKVLKSFIKLIKVDTANNSFSIEYFIT